MRKINNEIKNNFLFQAIYGLFYPATLGAILVYLLQDVFTMKLLQKGIFPITSLFCLVWYFVIDFYVGYSNFKGRENEYNLRYVFCDVIIIITALLAYYGLWLSDKDFLFFISLSIMALTLLVLDYFDAMDAKMEYNIRNFYSLILLTLVFISSGITLISLMFPNSLFYLIFKNLFILIIGIGLVYYTFYILSDESFNVK